jgi:hypothetical protein
MRYTNITDNTLRAVILFKLILFGIAQWSSWSRSGLIGGAGSIVHSWSQARKVAGLNFEGWPTAFDEILVIEFSGIFNPADGSEKLSFVHRALVLDQPVSINFVRDVMTLRQLISLCRGELPRGNEFGADDAFLPELHTARSEMRSEMRSDMSTATPRLQEDWAPSSARYTEAASFPPREPISQHYAWMLEDFDSAAVCSRKYPSRSGDALSSESPPATRRSFPILSYRRAGTSCSYLQDSNRTTYPIIARPRQNKALSEIDAAVGYGSARAVSINGHL